MIGTPSFLPDAGLLAKWHARAAQTEKQRRLPRETVDELFDAGLMQLLIPKRHGGLERDWPDLVMASRIAARVCASTGWMIGVVGGHAAIVARLPEQCQAVIFETGPRQVFTTVSATPTGRLIRDGAGYRIDGVWRFGSGVDHATWISIYARCENHPNPPDPNIFLVTVPASAAVVEDRWHVNGMRGTGSQDVRFDNLFVEADWVIKRAECLDAHPPGSPGASGPYILDVPFIPYGTSAILGPILGCAEGAFHECLELLNARRMAAPVSASSGSLAERVAESSAELTCAAHLFGSVLDRLHGAGQERRGLTSQEFLFLKRDRAYMVRLCQTAVGRLVRSLGTDTIYDSHPVHRKWRDLQTMATHIDVNWDIAMLSFGEQALTLAHKSPEAGGVGALAGMEAPR